MEKTLINLKNKADFMSLLLGDQIFEFSSAHGEDSPIVVNSWVVIIEPTKAGDIPKLAIQSKDKIDEQIFFIHLLENKNIIIDDDGNLFFDFNKNEEGLQAKKSFN